VARYHGFFNADIRHDASSEIILPHHIASHFDPPHLVSHQAHLNILSRKVQNFNSPSRQAFHKHKMSDSNANCPSDAFFGVAEPIAGSMSFHTLATIISAACAGLTLIIGLGLSFLHMIRYTRPHEQRQ
jgi:hypothetical protein